MTFYAATLRPLGAAVTFYGGGVVQGRFGFPPLVDRPPACSTPWLGLYGDLDQSIPPNTVEQPAERPPPPPSRATSSASPKPTTASTATTVPRSSTRPPRRRPGRSPSTGSTDTSPPPPDPARGPRRVGGTHRETTLTTATTEEPYDPFAAFDDVVGGSESDPYPMFAERRRTTPVWRGIVVNPDLRPPGDNEWVTFRYDDCSRVFRDGKTFSSAGYDSTIGVVMGHMLLGMDDPSIAVTAAWSRGPSAAIARAMGTRVHRPDLPRAHRPLRGAGPRRPRARGHLRASRCGSSPASWACPTRTSREFQRWSIELIGVAADIRRGLAASASLRDYFAGIVAERRRSPRDDVISDLVTAEIDGEHLDDEAIYSFLRMLLPAGAETTYRSTGNLLFLLLSDPEQLEAVTADRTLLPGHRGVAPPRAAPRLHRPHRHR